MTKLKLWWKSSKEPSAAEVELYLEKKFEGMQHLYNLRVQSFDILN